MIDTPTKEYEWTRLLTSCISPAAPELAATVAEGLARSLPAVRRDRYLGAVEAWSLNGPPATDVAIADQHRQLLGLVEAKRASTHVNWPSRSVARRLRYGEDDLSQLIKKVWVDDTDEELDEVHSFEDCRDDPCDSWVWARPREGDLHYPAVPQADLYAATLNQVPDTLRVESLRGVDLLLVAPTERCFVSFVSSAVSGDLWWWVDVKDVLRCWISAAPIMCSADLDRLIRATEVVFGL